jgi:mono/diheme cytochrome c family protein
MSRTRSAIMAFVLAWPAGLSLAAEPVQQTAEAVNTGEGGGNLFKTYCAVCHGVSAKGDGPLAAGLRFRPSDLTRIAVRNGGKFDAAKVHRIIDGRNQVKGHGGPDMPVWGDAFKQSGEGYSEEAVKARIQALVVYLESIQVKSASGSPRGDRGQIAGAY